MEITATSPPLPEFPSPKFDAKMLILAIILSYILRIAYIKYIKPKIEKGEAEKPKITLDLILRHISEIARIAMYFIMIFIALIGINLVQTMPDETVEVPVKFFILMVTLMTLFAVYLMSLLNRG